MRHCDGPPLETPELLPRQYVMPIYGFNQLFLLMEKQHNRGQDGAGIGCVKLNMPAGQSYMARERSIQSNSLSRIFQEQLKDYTNKLECGTIHPEFVSTVKENFAFGGEALLGHLRYGTSGVYSNHSCHHMYASPIGRPKT